MTHSQAAFVNWPYVAKLTIVHSKTQINQVSIIIFIIINKGAVTMKTTKTSRKICKSRTLIMLPHFPLENPNLEKKHLTPTISFLSLE